MKFTVHVLLKPGLENFEHYFTSVHLCGNLSILWHCFSLDSYGTPECDAEPPGGGPGPAFLNLPVLESLSSLLDFIINLTHPCPVSSISKPKKSMNYNHCLLNSPYFNTSISALLTMPKLLTVWITINCGKFFKRWEYQIT